MTINFYFAIFLTSFFMLVLPTTLLVVFKNKPKVLKICISILFVLYLILLLVGTLGSISLKNNSISISFNFSNDWFSPYFSWFELSKTNVIINTFMFFPIGFVTYSFCNQHKFLKTALISLFISVLIETLQFILPVVRNTEFSDILFNTLSGLISASYCTVLTKLTAQKNTID